jgi:hypothetical protein
MTTHGSAEPSALFASKIDDDAESVSFAAAGTDRVKKKERKKENHDGMSTEMATEIKHTMATSHAMAWTHRF